MDKMIDLLNRFKQVVLAKKNGDFNNLSSVTKNIPTVEEIKEDLKRTWSTAHSVNFYFSSNLTDEEMYAIFAKIQKMIDYVPVCTDNGFDYLLSLIDASMGSECKL